MASTPRPDLNRDVPATAPSPEQAQTEAGHLVDDLLDRCVELGRTYGLDLHARRAEAEVRYDEQPERPVDLPDPLAPRAPRSTGEIDPVMAHVFEIIADRGQLDRNELHELVDPDAAQQFYESTIAPAISEVEDALIEDRDQRKREQTPDAEDEFLLLMRDGRVFYTGGWESIDSLLKYGIEPERARVAGAFKPAVAGDDWHPIPIDLADVVTIYDLREQILWVNPEGR